MELKTDYKLVWLLIVVGVILQVQATYVRLAAFEQMKCTYGERGSLTATCVNASSNYFKSTPYRFDHLDETLRCVNCSLKTIESETFDISGNQIKNLDLSNSLIKMIRQKAFVGLIFLENLILSNNEIPSIYPGTFTGVKKIKFVDLEHNLINVLSDDGFLELLNLQKLNLQYNSIRTISSKAFNGLTNLKELNLCHNNITELGTALSYMTALQTINLQHNNIITLTGQEFFNLTSLLDIDLANNKLVSPVIHFNTQNQLRRLDLSNNNINRIVAGSFKGLSSLEDFDLSYNHIYEIPQKTLQSLYNLRHFNISYNKLTKFQTGLFSGLPQLRVLNCSHNSLQEIEITGVFSLHSLHTLDVSYNELSDLDYSALISRLPRIAYLEMQNNVLPCDLEKEMEVFFSEDNFKYVLYGNTVGALKCVDTPMKKKTFKEVADSLEVKASSGGSKTVEIFLFIGFLLLLIVVCVIFYVLYRFSQAIKYDLPPVRTSSTARLVTSDLQGRDNDYLRE